MTTPQKEIALAFQKLVVAGRIREAYEKYIHSEFFHHNPYFKGDRQSLLEAMEENYERFPSKAFEPQTIIEEGDKVMIHSKIILSPDMPPIAAIHIFRFQDGLIIEEWDLGLPVSPDSQNENGMF